MLPYGKFKGKPLGEVPVPYLRWARDNLGNLSRALQKAIRAEIARRSAPTPARTPLPLAQPTPEPASAPEPTDLLGRARQLLLAVTARANQLQRQKPKDTAAATALFGAALAASATLSAENLHDLEEAARAGRLPREKAP
jgi:hypothetical protein